MKNPDGRLMPKRTEIYEVWGGKDPCPVTPDSKHCFHPHGAVDHASFQANGAMECESHLRCCHCGTPQVIHIERGPIPREERPKHGQYYEGR